jgi:cell wall-associated NlpC family hydrolase
VDALMWIRGFSLNASFSARSSRAIEGLRSGNPKKPKPEKNSHVVFSAGALLAVLTLAGCASIPPSRPPSSSEVQSSPIVDDLRDEGDWDGSGGAVNMRNRGEALADFALRLRGTPYRFGGASLAGFDCSGLVFYAHRQLGLTVPRTSREQEADAENIKPRKLRRGDLVFFKIGSRKVNHVGIYIGKSRFVHAPGAGKPVTINSLDDDFYAETFFSAGRYWDRWPH